MYILGIGSFGAIVYELCKRKNIGISAFIDLGQGSQRTSFVGVPVVAISEVTAGSELIVVSNRWNHGWINHTFGSGMNLVYPEELFDSFKDIIDSDYEEIAGVTWSKQKVADELKNYLSASHLRKVGKDIGVSPRLITLDIEVTERCTLKCQDCSNLMQYYSKPVDPNIKKGLFAMKRLLESCHVGCIRIIGGEPLIARDLEKYLLALKDEVRDRYDRIEIYTNGTIIPSEQVLEILVDLPVTFYVSNYGDLSRRLNQLCSILKERQISYTVEDNLIWQDCGRVLPYSGKEIQYRYANCCVSKNFSLLEDRLFSCPFSANFHRIYQEDLITDRDFISLSDITDSELFDKLNQMIFEEQPLSSCYHCAGRDYTVGTVEVAKQSSNVLKR